MDKPLQGYYPLEPEMLLFCCCFYLRCFLIVLKDFTLCSLLFIDSLTLAPSGVDLRFTAFRRVVEGLPEK